MVIESSDLGFDVHFIILLLTFVRQVSRIIYFHTEIRTVSTETNVLKSPLVVDCLLNQSIITQYTAPAQVGIALSTFC